MYSFLRRLARPYASRLTHRTACLCRTNRCTVSRTSYSTLRVPEPWTPQEEKPKLAPQPFASTWSSSNALKAKNEAVPGLSRQKTIGTGATNTTGLTIIRESGKPLSSVGMTIARGNKVTQGRNIPRKIRQQNFPQRRKERYIQYVSVRKPGTLVHLGPSKLIAPSVDDKVVRSVDEWLHKIDTPFYILPVGLPFKTMRWAIIGPSNARKVMMRILRGDYEMQPGDVTKVAEEKFKEESRLGRKYPFFHTSGIELQKGIALVEFSADEGGLGAQTRGEYMSSRYESRRESTDITLREWLRRTAEGLPLYTDNFDFESRTENKEATEKINLVASSLKLDGVLDQPVSTLSNGQGRRARIAQKLLRHVHLLLLDEPFMGLDFDSTAMLSSLLDDISRRPPGHPDFINSTTPVLDDATPTSPITCQVVIGLRNEVVIPRWISHYIHFDPKTYDIIDIHGRSSAKEVASLKAGLIKLSKPGLDGSGIINKAYSTHAKTDTEETIDTNEELGEVLIDMKDVHIAYKGKEIFRDLNWKIRRGERWGLFGPNGSGKTTILSLVTSDHPQSYSLPITIFGASRLPTPGIPGISIFDIQAKIGQSSPEIHQFFPRQLSLRKCVESAFAETFLAKPTLTPEASAAIDTIFTHFDIAEPQQAEPFGGQTVSMQKLVLFMRAVVKKCDIVTLDEAFSGMDTTVRDKCMKWLEDELEDRQALVCISHTEEEVPGVVNRFVRLEEAGSGKGPAFGNR